jgi:aquaporin related protein
MTGTHKSPFSSQFKEDCYAAFLEFIGTVFFLLLGFGGIQSAATMESIGNLEKVMYISTCMGLSLLVSAWLFYRVTGSLFNPNISLALLLVGIISPVRFALFCIAQMSGAIAASGLVMALTPGKLAVNNTLHEGISRSQGVFIEMFITAALVLAVLMLAAEKHHTTPFAPVSVRQRRYPPRLTTDQVGIGLTLFACHLFVPLKKICAIEQLIIIQLRFAVFYTGAAMNTARAFGPAAVTGFPDKAHWVVRSYQEFIPSTY